MQQFKKQFYDLKARAEARREADVAAASTVARKPISEFAYHLYARNRPQVRGLKCLEVGVGSGWAMHDMLNAGCKWIDGIDVSAERIEQTSNLLKAQGFANFSLWEDDAETLARCPDDTYDYVNFSDVLEHVTDADATLKTLHRVLKKKGRIYLKTPNDYTDAQLRLHHLLHIFCKHLLGEELDTAASDLMLRGDVERLDEAELAELKEAIPEGFREHVHQFEPAELVETMRKHGFKIVALTGMPLFSDILYQHETQLVSLCEMYVEWAGSASYQRFVQKLSEDLQRTGRKTEWTALPADYVFSDNLVVIAEKE